MSYEVIAEANGEEVIHYEHYGSYQGDFILVTFKDPILRIYKDYYGSCSGCDAYEGFFDYDESPTMEKKKEFAARYKPFLDRHIGSLTYQDIVDGVTFNNASDRDFSEEDKQTLIYKIAERFNLLPQ